MGLPSHIIINLSENDLKKCSEGDLNCELCCKKFKNKNALRMHKVKTHNEVCSEADFRLRHRQQNHKQEVEHWYLCPVPTCSRSKEPDHFIALKLLKQHYMKVHTMKTLRLCICEQELSDVDKLRDEALFKSKDFLKVKQSRKLNCELSDRDMDLITGVEEPSTSCAIPFVTNKSVGSVSTQTALDETLDCISQDICQHFQNTKELNKDASTNVTSLDLGSFQENLLPFIDSVSFQSDRRFNEDDFCSRRIHSSSTQSLNYPVSQSDCAVQSDAMCVPETRHVETHMDDFDFEEIWHSIETQTSETYGSDALTQTVTDFMDCGIMTDQPYQPWNET
uniref:C2H2-type domain-containing protein n=1 Tax=Syphacia muris TaxID=451379 RepID=A0A0N5AHV7_9BILA